MLVVFATLKAKPGRGDDLEREFKKMVPVFRQEEGIITFNVHRALDNPDTFYLYEQYRDKADLDAHFAGSHFKTFGRGIAEMIEGRAQMTFCREI